MNDAIDNQIIVLGGVGRTGTTIMSKLIGSLKNVELYYEPKTIDLLFAIVDKIESTYWKLLFKRNIYDDLLINSLAGRNMNLNRNDDSCVYNYKDEEYINKRLEKSYGQLEIEPIAREKVIAFKILNNIVNIDKVKNYFPNVEPLFIFRDPNSVLNSLIRKGWFSDEAISIDSPAPASLFNIYKKRRVPNFVPSSDYDRWLESSELDRSAYYYITVMNSLRKYLNDSYLFIDYNDLIKDPEKTLQKIKDYYQLSEGNKTQKILNTIKYQEKSREDLLSKLDISSKNNLLSVYQEFKNNLANFQN